MAQFEDETTLSYLRRLKIVEQFVRYVKRKGLKEEIFDMKSHKLLERKYLWQYHFTIC